MRRRAMKFLGEPLVHFMIGGSILFTAYGLTAKPDLSSARDRIVVTRGEAEQLAGAFQRRRLRLPTDAEMKGLVADYVREEVLYREALALGLDRDDAVVRRTLRQKYEFVTQDLATPSNPSSAELAAWYEAHRERYRNPRRVSFTQLQLASDPAKGSDDKDASLMLASLQGGADPDTVGAAPTRLLDADYQDLPVTEVAARFGQAFADSIAVLQPGVWSGPVRSGYGLHLVRVTMKSDGGIRPFDAVADTVRNDFLYDQRRQANDAIYGRLLQRYDVIFEDVSPRETSGQERP